MKFTKFGVAALVVAACMVTGCASSNKDGSMGAVGEKKSCSEKCSTTCTDKGNMGAVGEKKSGCCSEKAKTQGNMGAVSEKKSGCCSASAPKN